LLSFPTRRSSDLSASSAAAKSASAASSRSERTSRAPSTAKALAAPLPRPPVAPAISTAAPSKRPIAQLFQYSNFLIDQVNRKRGEQLHRLAIGPGLFRIGGVAVQRAAVDTLADRRQPEEAEG